MISGNIDTGDVDKLLEKLKGSGKTATQLEEFYTYIIHQVMARILRNLYKRTPVSQNETIQYYAKGGQIKTLAIKGGALRRGWFEDQDVGAGGIASFANHLPIAKTGNTYTCTVSNTQEYAPFVEYGHRPATGQFVPFLGGEDENGVRTGAKITRTNKVEGQYILRNSVHNVKQILSSLIERELSKFMKGLL